MLNLPTSLQEIQGAGEHAKPQDVTGKTPNVQNSTGQMAQVSQQINSMGGKKIKQLLESELADIYQPKTTGRSCLDSDLS